MGYTTDFYGSFELDRPLTEAHGDYLRAFALTRRMKRDATIANTYPDPKREAVGLPIGDEGAYFVGGQDFRGGDKDPSVLDYNRPPSGQPGLWCQWQPFEDNMAIEWDGGEKFYDYAAWLKYIVEHFLAPWGYVLNGEVEWKGEDSSDQGILGVKDNKVYVKVARVVFGDAEYI